MKGQGFQYRFRAPVGPPEERGGKRPAYSRKVEGDILIERDVPVAMRDGVEILIDVLRPADEIPAPPIVCWGPYGKHGHTKYATQYPNCGLDQNSLSPLTAFEGLDPSFWVPRGYAVINVDPRGTWYSKGDATFLSPEEARDFFDLIEWAGTQYWSNGKVGLSGVSYLAAAQWWVAALRPPHLAAINPWEGWSDTYREVVHHGGIPETWFWPFIPGRWGISTTRVEDVLTEANEHPFYDAFWSSKAAQLENIEVPAFVVASWSDQGLHTRGTLEGFKKIGSRQRWLEVHGRKKWQYYYEIGAMLRLQEFFDFFLKGIPSPIMERPRVRVEVRERYYVGRMVSENEWPIARTEYTKLYLDPDNRTLSKQSIQKETNYRYGALPDRQGDNRAFFEFRFDSPIELIGHMKLKLWMSTDLADDMDIFVAIQKVDPEGNIVGFPFANQFEDGPVALGWLRASHRELDAEKSTDYQPVLAHKRELKIEPEAIVPLEIEVWPSGTRFETGETLRLVVQGSDIYPYPKPIMVARHESTVNRGNHVIYAGGVYDSYLLVPVVSIR